MAAKKDSVTGLTPREEAFAQGVAKGLDQAEAFRVTHPHARRWKPESVWVKASQMAARDKVQTRVRQLQSMLRAEAENKLRFGIAEAFEMADEAFECGKKFEQAGAMVSAATLKAKIAGLIVHKQERIPGLLDGLSDEDVRAIRDAIEESIAEAACQRAAQLPNVSAIDHSESEAGKPHQDRGTRRALH